MIIKKANSCDFEEILKLSNVFDSSETDREEKIKQALANGLVYVVKDGKGVVGYVLCQFFGANHKELPNSVFISDLFVLDSYRKRGIGRWLLLTVLESDFPANYTHFSITYDPEEKHLTDFYKSFGFEIVGKTKAGNVKMMKEIDELASFRAASMADVLKDLGPMSKEEYDYYNNPDNFKSVR